jgi:FkbM family methyltransferase
MRCTSMTDAGYRRNAYRVVAPHRRDRAPGLIRLPESWWQSDPELRVRRLGLEFELDLRDNLQRTLYFTGAYEPGVLRFLTRESRPGDVIVDAGAHIGVHALPLARHLATHGGGRVIAFEPASDSIAKLRRAAQLNGVELTFVHAALDSSAGRFDLFSRASYGPADTGVRSRHADGPHVETVQSVSFDEWAASAGLERMDMVKLDVEGDEMPALQGMETSLRRLRPRALIVETRDDTTGGSSDERTTFLAEVGYRPTGITLFSANRVFVPRGYPAATGTRARVSSPTRWRSRR